MKHTASLGYSPAIGQSFPERLLIIAPSSNPQRAVGDDQTTRHLRELAARKASATKKRLTTRIAAARLFSGAVARLAEAKAAWERAQAEPQRVQAEAAEDLLRSGRQPDEVAKLLGISVRRTALQGQRQRGRQGPDSAGGSADELDQVTPCAPVLRAFASGEPASLPTLAC